MKSQPKILLFRTMFEAIRGKVMTCINCELKDGNRCILSRNTIYNPNGKCPDNNSRCIEMFLKRFSSGSVVDQSFRELQRDILRDFCKENNIEIITGE